MRIHSTKAFRCTEDWLDTLCKRRVCGPTAAKRRGCTEGRFYHLRAARLLERAARLAEEWNDIQNDYSAKSFHRESQWRHKLARWLADWRKAMEKTKENHYV